MEGGAIKEFEDLKDKLSSLVKNKFGLHQTI
jgi:hypothetical protein